MNIYKIKISKKKYIIFNIKIDNFIKNFIAIYANIDFKINFINKFLLFKNINLYNRLIIIFLIIIYEIIDDKIYDKYIYIRVDFININEIFKTILYIIKKIKINVILNNDIIFKKINQIFLYLIKKIM